MTLDITRSLALGGVVIAAAAIAGAWGFQLIGGIEPCPLCLEQRVPYYAGLPLAVVAFFLLPRMWGRLFALGAAVAMAWTMGLGIFHAGAEWALWDGPNTCAAGGSGTVTDASTLLAAVESANFVNCLEDTGRVLGLSFAGWNAVASGSAMLMFVGATFSVRLNDGTTDVT